MGPCYEVDEFLPLYEIYPAALVRVDPPAVRRSGRQARVLFQPFQWDPADGRLRCATRLRVRLAYEQPLDYTGGQDKPDHLPALPGDAFGPRLGGALRIEVDEDGLYAMDYRETLRASGMDGEEINNLDPATLKLFNQGREIPMVVAGSGQEPPWPGGNLFFYGQAIDSPYTRRNVYWLYWDGAPGARMEIIDGALSGSGALVPWSQETVRCEENQRLWEATPGAPDEDYWFLGPAHRARRKKLPAGHDRSRPRPVGRHTACLLPGSVNSDSPSQPSYPDPVERSGGGGPVLGW